MIAEVGEAIGVATNNVAEYRGLIAGLRARRRARPGATIEVRMDSKLVVEQMSGNWKVKHPAMRPLAVEANRLAPAGTTFTWVPRAENAHADRLVNEALDGLRDAHRPASRAGRPSAASPGSREQRPAVERAARGRSSPRTGWSSGVEPNPRLAPADRTSDHADPGAPRRHRPHRAQAVLRWSGQREPAAERRGPRAGPGHRASGSPRCAERDRRAGELAGAAHPRVRGDPRRAARPDGGRRGGASPRWSSAPGTG